MNLKNIAIVTALITAPVGTTAAIAAKHKKAETPVVEKAPEYKLSAQDYKTYVAPQIINTQNPNSILNTEVVLNAIKDRFLEFSDEKRDSVLDVVQNNVETTVDKFATEMESLKNIAKDKEDKFRSINLFGKKTTDLNDVLTKAAIEEGNVIQLYSQINDVDKSANGKKSIELKLPDKNFSELTDSVLGMNLSVFTKTFEKELYYLKNKKIDKEPALGTEPVELTEKEQFVLDKIEELENAVNEHYATAYSKAGEHAAARTKTTFDEVESAMGKLTEFSDTKDENFDIVGFASDESEIVSKTFLVEMVKILETPTSINNAKTTQKPAARKIVQDGKVIIEVANPKDGSVTRFTQGGQIIK